MKLMLLTIAIMGLSASAVFAEKATKKTEIRQEMEEVGRDTKRGASKAMRSVKDETCELINGKMECAVKKAKHSIQNGADNVEDAVE